MRRREDGGGAAHDTIVEGAPAATTAERAIAAAAWLTLVAGFAWCIGLGPWAAWYSPSLPHRLQTEALLRGTFALNETPHGQMADWAWGNGSQHVWGLGPALWRLPFEAAAHAVGAIGFPDRMALLAAFVGVCLLAARAFVGVGPWERVALVVVTVATPAFVALSRTRLAVYEESVAYAHLVAIALASLLLRFATRGRDVDFVAAAALAGIAFFFRPTLLFTGAVTVGLGVAWRVGHRGEERSPWPPVAAALAVFAAGLAVVGIVNVRRFGSPFETGQLLNVSYIPTDQAAKVFGYPFRDEPLGRAAAELASSLVLPARDNTPRWYARDIHPWQSPTVRFRELYFTPFTVWQLAVAAAGWLAIAGVGLAARRAARLRGWVAPPVGVAALWSGVVFALQTLFYLWAPSMTSRYAVDFAAPVAVATSALLLMAFRAADALADDGRTAVTSAARPAGTRTVPSAAAWHATTDAARHARLVLATLAVLWIAHDGLATEIAPSHRAGPLLDARRLAAALAARPRPVPGPVPTSYRCGDAPESGGIKFNGSGWSTPGDCTVHAATMLFLASPTCVRVTVAPRPGDAPLGSDAVAMVRAKLGLAEMHRTADVAAGDGRALTFCAPPGHRANPRGIELLYLGWVRPADLSPDVRPFRLVAVTAVDGA